MKIIKLFLFIGIAFADIVIRNTVVEETILHRVGLGKIKVRDFRLTSDGSSRINHEKSCKV